MQSYYGYSKSALDLYDEYKSALSYYKNDNSVLT